jgi:hypothetical protein
MAVPDDPQLALDLIAGDLPAAQVQANALGLELIRRAPESIDLLLPHHTAQDNRDYLIRLRCDGYDGVAPSFQFVDPTNPDLTGGQYWARMSGIGYARGDLGEVVFCTAGVREYHQHPSHRGEVHPKSTWRLARVVTLVWDYFFRSGDYIGPGVA